MPIYEYECNRCHHTFDVLQKFSDEPVKACPECSENTVVRLVSAAGFQLKGTGWYVTDFKDKGKPSESQTKDAVTPSSDVKPVEAATPSTKSKGESV